MIELNYKNLNTPAFTTGLAKILKETNVPIPLGVELVRIARRVHDERITSAAAYRKLLEKYGTLAGNSFTFHSDEGREAYLEELKAFEQVSFQVEADKVKLDQLGDVRLSPVELMALEPILDVQTVSG